MIEPSVRQNAAQSTYEILVGGDLAGLTRYVDRGQERVFVHTETEPGFAGQGLASVLVREALESTRSEGMRIIAVCPFVAAYVHGHHDFDDILDPVHAEHPRAE